MAWSIQPAHFARAHLREADDQRLHYDSLFSAQPDAPSMFELLALLREVRRQKGLPAAELPEISILDPDDDIVRCFKDSGAAKRVETWPLPSHRFT